MGNIEHWDAGICPACGTLYAEIFTLCECELPGNVEGVEVERVRLVRDSRLQGAVDLLHRWLIEASAMGGGPRAQLTQDTLDAVGMPPDHPGGQYDAS